jgi:hypothetical protein
MGSRVERPSTKRGGRPDGARTTQNRARLARRTPRINSDKLLKGVHYSLAAQLQAPIAAIRAKNAIDGPNGDMAMKGAGSRPRAPPLDPYRGARFG